MYSGRIIRVTNLRRHNNADRLQCTEICGYNIIVDGTCEIGEHAFGKYFFFKYLHRAKFPYEEYRTYKNFRIICEKGSAAERYAKENGQTFYLI